MHVRRASSEDWSIVRDLRLRALREDATAFGSTFERESTFDEATWRARLVQATTFLAYHDEAPIGSATGLPMISGPLGARSPVELVGMWVAPEGRATGAGLALVRAVIEWAGARPIVLWVADEREAARKVYEKAGFRATGKRGEMEAHPGVTVHEMVRPQQGDSRPNA